nr:hypothetical protein CFP56_32136 [Quercus suber]
MAGAPQTFPTNPHIPDDLSNPQRPDPIPPNSTDPSDVSTSPQMRAPSVSTSHLPASNLRNRSPYSRSHARSTSSDVTLLDAPLMTRAKSMPNPHTLDLPSTSTAFMSSTSAVSSSARSSSPNSGDVHSLTASRSVRAHSPLRFDDGDGNSQTASSHSHMRGSHFRCLEVSPSALTGSVVQTIEEHSELDIRPRSAIPSVPLPAASAAFARSSSLRRRPASPLHSTGGVPTMSAVPISDTPPSTSSSPSLGPMRFVNETYPQLHHSASTSSFSSVPSTPSSIRSRSPSISSLDTIEDTPDLESEAIELERIERLKISAERAERAERGQDTDEGGRRRGSFDVPRTGFGRIGRAGSERKRWSICGGERRGDLDLETIWED